MEPMSASDILLYEPLAVNATVKAAVSVTVDLQTRGWIISGHAHEDAYSQIFQVRSAGLGIFFSALRRRSGSSR